MDLTNYSFTNLKYLEVKKMSVFDFILSNINLQSCNKLEILNLDDFDYLREKNINIKIEYFKTLLFIKTLKEIKLVIKDINELIEVEGENTSVTKLYILLVNNNNNCLYEFQKKFPNLEHFIIEKENYDTRYNDYNDYIGLIENSKYKVKNVKIDCYKCHDIKLYCDKYENLTNISISIKSQNTKIKNLKIPLFNDICNIVFHSLIEFELDSDKLDLCIVENIYKNFDKLPNLKYFYIRCITPEIDKEFHKKFIIKILSSFKLNKINIFIKKEDIFCTNLQYFTFNELKEIYPKIKQRKYKDIEICKLTKEKNSENCLAF